MTERRVIRIRYAVTINGKKYSSPGFDAGETIMQSADNEEGNRISAVCHALGIDAEEYTREAWELALVKFDYCEEI